MLLFARATASTHAHRAPPRASPRRTSSISCPSTGVAPSRAPPLALRLPASQSPFGHRSLASAASSAPPNRPPAGRAPPQPPTAAAAPAVAPAAAPVPAPPMAKAAAETTDETAADELAQLRSMVTGMREAQRSPNVTATTQMLFQRRLVEFRHYVVPGEWAPPVEADEASGRESQPGHVVRTFPVRVSEGQSVLPVFTTHEQYAALPAANPSMPREHFVADGVVVFGDLTEALAEQKVDSVAIDMFDETSALVIPAVKFEDFRDMAAAVKLERTLRDAERYADSDQYKLLHSLFHYDNWLVCSLVENDEHFLSMSPPSGEFEPRENQMPPIMLAAFTTADRVTAYFTQQEAKAWECQQWTGDEVLKYIRDPNHVANGLIVNPGRDKPPLAAVQLVFTK